MSEINFDYGKIFMVEIEHRSGGDGVWVKTLNAESDSDAISKAYQLYEKQGLNPLLIDKTWSTELIKGEDGGQES